MLTPEGATFTTQGQRFLVSDNPDFHPTDVLEDADGSLLVIDTGGWYKLCCPTSQLAKPDVLGASIGSAEESRGPARVEARLGRHEASRLGKAAGRSASCGAGPGNREPWKAR